MSALPGAWALRVGEGSWQCRRAVWRAPRPAVAPSGVRGARAPSRGGTVPSVGSFRAQRKSLRERWLMDGATEGPEQPGDPAAQDPQSPEGQAQARIQNLEDSLFT